VTNAQGHRNVASTFATPGQAERSPAGNLQIIPPFTNCIHAQGAHPLEAAVQNLNGLSILIVEDEYLLALSLMDALIDAGCKIIGPVDRVDAAFDAVRTNWVDGAILDVNLHGEKSYPVMDTLAEFRTPFVIYSGNQLSTLPSRFSDRPALMKPTDPETIITTLTRVVANADSQMSSQTC
jgi:CheY-like chemotaxis protein